MRVDKIFKSKKITRTITTMDCKKILNLTEYIIFISESRPIKNIDTINKNNKPI